jgi:hypothetical protein
MSDRPSDPDSSGSGSISGESSSSRTSRSTKKPRRVEPIFDPPPDFVSTAQLDQRLQSMEDRMFARLGALLSPIKQKPADDESVKLDTSLFPKETTTDRKFRKKSAAGFKKVEEDAANAKKSRDKFKMKEKPKKTTKSDSDENMNGITLDMNSSGDEASLSGSSTLSSSGSQSSSSSSNSAGSSSSDSQSSFPSEAKKKKKKSKESRKRSKATKHLRRNSMLDPTSGGEAPTSSSHVVVTQTLAPTTHLRFKAMTLRSLKKFTADLIAYKLREGIAIRRAVSYVDESARLTIMTVNRLSLKGFYKLSNKELFSAIQRCIKPPSVEAFARALASSLDFYLPEGFEITFSNFQYFYTQLKSYRRDYREKLDLLSRENVGHVPPAGNDKEGLIAIFLSKLPEHFARSMYKSLRHSRYHSIEAFLKSFFKEAKATWEVAVKTQEFSQHLAKPGSSKGYTASRQAPSDPRPNQLAQVSERVAVAGGGNSDTDDDYALQMAAENQHFLEREEDSDGPLKSVPADDEVSPHELGYVDQKHLQLFQPRGAPAPRPAPDGTRKPPIPGSNVCFRVLKGDKCTDSRCNYAHSQEAVVAAIKAILDAHKDKLPVSDILAPKRPPPKPPESNSPENIYNLSVDSMEALLHFLAPESQPRTPVHRVISIALTGNDSDPAGLALFDSGALHASYVRKSYVDDHREALSPYLSACNSQTRLADSSTVVSICEQLSVPVVIVGPDGEVFREREVFHVMPSLAEDFIIGMPSILSKWLDLFIAMMVEGRLLSDPTFELCQMADLIEPWENSPEDAPEDDEIPIPCSFRSVLHFMEMSPGEALQEYYSLFDSHVAPAFAKAVPVLDLLRQYQAVFVPTNWEGISGVDPIEFNWLPGIPTRMKPKARPINPKLWENAQKEFQRLLKYFYTPSDSPIASCLVVAPKATKPFIRFCGDYATMINKFIASGHHPIPDVRRSIDKIMGFRYFLDLDMANSFHQFRLGKKTASLLSVQTPWGQVEPMFIPEGVPPASGILQQTMEAVFTGFEDWMIVLFDNLLILATDYQDGYDKLAKVLQRCIDRNVILKFSKTWLGFDEVEFFGYMCSHNSYELTAKRKDSIMSWPFPQSTKQAQRFLGSALFFRHFVPNYSQLAAPLNELVHKSFDWSKASWTTDYEAAFESFKQALVNACKIHYPNYDLEWILRCDASDVAVGYVLFQILVKPNGETIHQPLVFGSKKFSGPATRWSVYDKEAFAMFWAVQDNQYLLRAKHFILEGDHANLKWMEYSTNPRVMRQRIYLQGFSFLFRPIPGKSNGVADWQSRLELLNRIVQYGVTWLSQLEEKQAPSNQLEMIKRCHCGRAGHIGVKRTWALLNKHYPGHGIPLAAIYAFIDSCGVCQKVRYTGDIGVKPIVRTLRTNSNYRVVGIDWLSLIEDSFGNTGVYVVKNLFTKHLSLYPFSTNSMENAATSLFCHYVRFSTFDAVASDPGSELMSHVVNQLNQWFGVHHRVSLVDRHTSNGVEEANKETLRYLRTLVLEERIKDRWSTPTVLGWVILVLNTMHDSETGFSPNLLTFGSDIAVSLKFPSGPLDRESAPKFLRMLDDDLRALRSAADKNNKAVVDKRLAENNGPPQNLYQPGDFVVLKRPMTRPLPSKLSFRYAGPYEVLSHTKNDVSCRHLASGRVQDFDVSDLNIFAATRDESIELAIADIDHYEVKAIVRARGDPLTRTTMEFFVQFMDGSELWIPLNKDLFDLPVYEDFVRTRPYLMPLLYPAAEVSKYVASLNRSPITEVSVGDTVLVDLRSWGHLWYQSLGLPDADSVDYVVECFYTRWVKKPSKLALFCPALGESHVVSRDFVLWYGRTRDFDPQRMVLVDAALVHRFPAILTQALTQKKK